MSMHQHCDRCNSSMLVPDGMIIDPHYTAVKIIGKTPAANRRYDLCSRCMSDLDRFIVHKYEVEKPHRPAVVTQ